MDSPSRSSDIAVAVRDLSMTYRVPVRDAGLGAAVRSVVRRRYRRVDAVRDLSFDIPSGQIVGFLGRNGAGKTTTMKILSGILHPTVGEVDVLGHVPWQRRNAYLKKIAFIRGSQPLTGAPELTVMDSFRYQQVLYDLAADDFDHHLAELRHLLDLGPILQRQIRALSLGERMRAGLALALLYRPEVLFLDEPTIGLDVSVAKIIRTFIADYCATTGATVLLTSHSMVDVDSLCPRLILIDEGALTFDGSREALGSIFAPTKLIRATVADAQADLSAYGDVLQHEADQWLLRVGRDAVPRVTGRLLQQFPISDLSVEEPSLEDVMDQAYRGLRIGGESGA